MAGVKRAGFVVVLGLVVACKADPTGGSTEGASIYDSVCASCHGPTGKPTEANAARLGVKDLTDPALRARMTPASVEQQVRNGSPNKLMPAFSGALTDAQIEAISEFVASPAFTKKR